MPSKSRQRIGFWTVLCLLLLSTSLFSQDPKITAAQVQKYYGSLKSMKIHFSQTYEANGILQEESGILWILKPGRMRWEYTSPENKLFLVDGKASYFYVPSDKQVSKRKLTQEDVRLTAFSFLVDQSNLEQDFQIETAKAESPIPENLRVLKLIPRRALENVEFLLLGIRPDKPEILIMVIQELTGARNSFAFSGMEENPTIKASLFELTVPKGVEVLSLDALP
jgi:outer membrane lipoprotein carrier protein